MSERPKLPMGTMKVSKAKQRWEDVRKAARSGDPAAMMDAVSRFEGVADTMLAYFANRDRLRAKLDAAKAENERLRKALSLVATQMYPNADESEEIRLNLYGKLTPERTDK